MTYLKIGLENWVDTDIAMYYIGCCLGIFPPPDKENKGFRKVKAILWSSNEIGDSLELILKRLYRNNVLLFDEEEEKYKWNKNFSLDIEALT